MSDNSTKHDDNDIEHLKENETLNFVASNKNENSNILIHRWGLLILERKHVCHHTVRVMRDF